MFSRMRRQLTAVCAAFTAAVLVIMAVFSLQFSLARLKQQADESFRSNINTVLFYLESQSVIDQTWLNQTETDNNLWIRIESRNAQLTYTGQSPEREQLTAAALSKAQNQYGADPFFSGNSLDPLIFQMETEDGKFYAGITSLPYKTDRLSVTILKDQAPDLTIAAQLKAVFAFSVLAAVLALTVFSWHFCGRIIRPVEENHRRQAEFVSAASHELRAPLSVISLSAQTVKRSPELALELADKIQRESDSMGKLVTNLLLLAQSGQQSLQPDQTDLSPKTILLTCMERFEALALEKNIQLMLDVEKDLPFSFRCSQEPLAQIFSIFLDNALRFTPSHGTIILGCRSSGTTRHPSISFFVSDSGPGVADEQKARIFDRFYQGDQSRTEKGHYGLGLSIAREMADAIGGAISVEDSPFGGACFTLQLALPAP